MAPLRRSTISPHKATLTEKNCPDLSGKVVIVTGATGGIGKYLTDILYQHNAKVYIAARSETKTKDLVNELKQKHPRSTGDLRFLKLELDDLTTIKASAEEFLSQETRLDVLYNNAGVMVPPAGSKTKQGYELQLGVNNIAHFLFTHFLTPILKETARTAPRDSVRVIWVSSSACDAAPKPIIDFSNMDYHKPEQMWNLYSRSKAGSALHAVEFARRNQGSGILSLSLNPGNFVTDLQNNMPGWQLFFFRRIAHEPINGAYTELFAGFDKSLTVAENQGGWITPFGKVEPIRKDILDPEQGRKYWDWTEAQVKSYY